MTDLTVLIIPGIFTIAFYYLNCVNALDDCDACLGVPAELLIASHIIQPLQHMRANPLRGLVHHHGYSLSGVHCKQLSSTSSSPSGFARSCAWPPRTSKRDSLCVRARPSLWAAITPPLMWVAVEGWRLHDVTPSPPSLWRTRAPLPMSTRGGDAGWLRRAWCWVLPALQEPPGFYQPARPRQAAVSLAPAEKAAQVTVS